MLNDPLIKLAFVAQAGNFLRRAGPMRGAMLGAGVMGAKSLISGDDLGDTAKNVALGAGVGAGAGFVNKSMRGANVKARAADPARAEAINMAGAQRAAARPMINPHASDHALEAGPAVHPGGGGYSPEEAADYMRTVHGEYIPKTAGLRVSEARFEKIANDIANGRAPEGAIPVIREIIKRAQANGITPTPELVAYNVLSYAAGKLAALEDSAKGDELPGNLKAHVAADKAKTKMKKAGADPTKLQLAAR